MAWFSILMGGGEGKGREGRDKRAKQSHLVLAQEVAFRPISQFETRPFWLGSSQGKVKGGREKGTKK